MDNVFKDYSGSSKWSTNHSSKAEESRPANWSNMLVEELLETNVIDSRNMAILKEQENSGSFADPAMLIDLRHDKLLRASLGPSIPFPFKSSAMAEAKRTMKNEEKAKKYAKVQNKMVDDEIKKFENHIVSLRKMNRRLDRLTCSSDAQSILRKSDGALKTQTLPVLSVGQPNITRNSPDCSQKFQAWQVPSAEGQREVPESHKGKSEPSSSQIRFKLSEQSSLVICGNRFDERELWQCKSKPSIHTSIGHRNTVFEQLQKKYAEAERMRIENDEVDRIRYSSPVTLTLKRDLIDIHQNPMTTQIVTASEANKMEEKPCNVLDTLNEPVLCDVSTKATKPNEWNVPVRMVISRNPEGKETKTEEKLMPLKISQPQVPQPMTIGKKTEKIKLDLMANAYSKWMRNVCEETRPNLKQVKGKEINEIKEKELMNGSGNREAKITQVLKTLQRHKETKTSNYTKDGGSNLRSQLSKSVNDIHDDRRSSELKRGRRVVSGVCEHRLSAQREIIIQQKVKLEEQRKQIEDFKLSQLKIETEKSKLQAQKTLNDILQSCDEETKVHAKPLQSAISFGDLCPGNAFVHRMEQRALEQRQKRQLSHERRKLFEEQWKMKVKEDEDKKRKEEEELMRKKNEELQELRRIEREARDEARKERERMILLERKAYMHCCQRILRKAFRRLQRLVILRKEQTAQAEQFYLHLILSQAFIAWKNRVDELVAAKMYFADNFYKLTLTRHCFYMLLQEQHQGATRMQVAVDMHDLQLQERVFQTWVIFTQRQHIHYEQKCRKADEHYRRILLKASLSQWRKLPRVAQQEREKERRKMVWRNKVHQMLPDFRPIISGD